MFKSGILAGFFAVIGILLVPQAVFAYQDGIAIRNKGGGGFYKAYRDLFACREDSPSSATCIHAFNDCGPVGIDVYITMTTAETIVDPNLGDYLQVAWVEDGTVTEAICTGQLR